MGQLGRGGVLLNVRQRTIVLSCAFIISLVSPDITGAVSMEPVLNTVNSVIKINNSRESATNDGRRGADKPESNARAATPAPTPSASIYATPTSTDTPNPISAVIAEPLEQLPSIDPTDMRSLSPSAYRPAVSLAVSPAVLGMTNDTAAPLQPSNQGWKLFGVTWYWWALIIAAGYYVVRRLQLLPHRRTAENAVAS